MDVINTENVQRAFQSGSGKAIKLRGETLNAIELRKQKELAVAKIDPVVEEEQAEKSAPVVEETPVSEEITKELETEEKEEVDFPSEKPLYNNDTRNYRNTSLISYFDKLKSMAKTASSGINSSSIYEQVIEECISIERQMNEVKESIEENKNNSISLSGEEKAIDQALGKFEEIISSKVGELKKAESSVLGANAFSREWEEDNVNILRQEVERLKREIEGLKSKSANVGQELVILEQERNKLTEKLESLKKSLEETAKVSIEKVNQAKQLDKIDETKAQNKAKYELLNNKLDKESEDLREQIGLSYFALPKEEKNEDLDGMKIEDLKALREEVTTATNKFNEVQEQRDNPFVGLRGSGRRAA